MDGSEVTVAVLGQKEVGKTTFIAHSLELFRSEVEAETRSTIHICGRDIRVKMVNSPEKLTPASVAIVLMDLTNEDALTRLPSSLELAQRLNPTAICAVVGTKADLYRNRKISTEDAVQFCKTWPQGAIPLPFYETGLDPPDSIMFAFQEILAKPLINDYVLKVTTEPELSAFICEAMDWCLDNGSANLLSHLRSLGHSIPARLFEKHTEVLSEYLFKEYPPILVPEFKKNNLSLAPEPSSFEDSLLNEPEEALQVIDTRPSLSVTQSYILSWKNLSLSVFLSQFFESQSLSLLSLSHVDLSHNQLSELPIEMFHLPALKSLNVAHNRITALPPVDHWSRKSKLQFLNAAHNSLTGGGSPILQRRSASEISVPFPAEVWNVDLSHNDFCGFPSWVLRFPSLRTLDLTGNPQIRKLPTHLCQMPHLMSLSVDSRTLTDPPPAVAKRGPVELLRYLQLKRQASQVWNSMRVVVVGPKGAGKSHLIAKLKEEKNLPSGPTKGLAVSEWRHRGSDFFSFKPKWITIDFWDFSGDPKYYSIYSCFKCSTSLHLVVCNSQLFERSNLIRWLSDIQATSIERIPVVIVFTHTDKFSSREQRDVFRKDVIQWLHEWEKNVLAKGRSHTFASIPQTVKNLYGEELTTSYESQPPKEPLEAQDSTPDDLPLLPAVHRVFFVNSFTGDGTSALRKCLVKIASGSLAPELARFSGFQMIGQDIPNVYFQVELLVRHLRAKFRSSRREGEQRPFYTVSELMHKKLKRPLNENGIQERDFTAALNFLHEYGFVYLHKCKEHSTTLVSVDPQLVGYLLQRMIRAGLVTQEVSATSCYLPNTHIFMVWGVEPIWSLELERENDTIYSQHLLDYLYNLNLCSPLLCGITLLPSILPEKLPSDKCPSPSPSLQCRRVYLFSYLPVHFFFQLVARVISSFLKTTGGFPSPISPGQASPVTAEVPFEMQSGLTLYVWKNNLFLKNTDGAQLLLKLLEGRDVCPSAEPYEARVDVLVSTQPETEAKWLRNVTMEIDYLLEHTYPGLLNSELSRQLVEIFVPLPFESGEEIFSEEEEEGERGGVRFRVGDGEREERAGVGDEETVQEEKELVHLAMIDGREKGEGHKGEDEKEEEKEEVVEKDGLRVGEEESVFAEDPPHSPQLQKPGATNRLRSWTEQPQMKEGDVLRIGSLGVGGGGEGEGEGGRGRRKVWGLPVVGSLPSYHSSPGSPRQRLLIEQTHNTSSWEVISKQSSSASTHFSIKTDYSYSHFLVPVWECLREAFKSPVVRVNNRKLCMSQLVPDLLFGDLPAELMFRYQEEDPFGTTTDSQNGTQTIVQQNGARTGIEWNGVQTGTKRTGLRSLTEQNRIQIDRLKQNRLETRTMGSNGVPAHTEQNGMQTDTGMQNGIGSHDMGQNGTQTGTSTSGLYIRSYYTSQEEEDCTRKEAGAVRMLYLKKCLQKAREDLNKLRQLQCPYLVSAIGVNFSPPSVAVESSPLGSLHRLMRAGGKMMVDIGSNTVHHILLQLLSALDYFHQEGLNYHTLCSENVLLWSMDPVSIKLSDSGITHTARGCELCSYIKAIPSKQKRKMTATRIDYMLLGLLIYEVATGKKPYENVYNLYTVVLALLNNRLKISVEAELKSHDKNSKKKEQTTVSCHRMCMQSTVDQCVTQERIMPNLLKARLSLCGGNHAWSPMRLTLNPECILCSEDGELVYWASGSRGLVTGTLEPSTGVLNSNVLQEAPKPESGLFAHRRGKAVPIAVGRATALTLVEETQQLWVGAENGSRGSVYVFNLPDMRRHNYIHLQDAVLSLAALNKTAVPYGGDLMKYRVLVGLANGTIIQFLGVHQGKILENPLQGPKLVIHLMGHRPCISMQLTSQGHVWCSSGSCVEVLDTVTLKSIRKLSLQPPGEEKEVRLQRSDVITLLSISQYGVWTVARRSPVLRLWNQESGKLIASYNIRNVLQSSEDDITAMALQGRVVWLGTRNGYMFLLDTAAVHEGREMAHLGLQHCGEGRVKNIVPLVSTKRVSAKLEVFCSLEFPDEVSGAVMTWEFQCQQQWRPRRIDSPSTRSHSLPLPLSSTLQSPNKAHHDNQHHEERCANSCT